MKLSNYFLLPHFINHLCVEKIEVNGVDKWILKESLLYISKVLKSSVVVPRGFLTDFASVPRVPVLYLFFGNVAHEAAVVHDYLYSELCCSRLDADRVFYEAMGVINIKWWRRISMYAAVRLAGRYYWENRPLGVSTVSKELDNFSNSA